VLTPDRPRGGDLTSDDRPSAGTWQTRAPLLVPIADVPAQPSRHLKPATRAFKQVSRTMAVTATVSVVIPARNEAPNLPHVFATMPQWVDEVILVDGQSMDDTIAVAQRLWPEIRVVRQAGRGKGDALLAGFAASTGDIIVTMDADGSTDGAEIIQFVAALIAGADFAKGSRFANSGGTSDMTATRRYGNRILSSLVNLLFGTRYTDLCYGYNAFWARHLAALALDCAGFEVETMMNIRAAEARLRVQEIPSFEHPRVYGSSNLRITIDGWRIAKVIVREWWRHHRARPLYSNELRSGDPFGVVIEHDIPVEPAETCVELT
jgi:glycosyltransferase involved in cell wall biosynthesis